MKSSEELDDMDKDSEFDSEAEDIEFRLYQQLYFEANPDGTEADTERRSPIEEQHEGEVNPNKTHDEQIAQLDGCQLDMLEMKSLTSPHKMPTIAFQNHETQSSQFDNCIYINTEEGTEVALTDYTANIDLGNTEEYSIGQKGKVNNNCDPVVPFSDGIPFVKENEISLQSARERLSSTCSDGSIRGSVPLDALYCTLVTSEEEDDTIDSRLILKNIETDDQERIKEKSNKRKRGNISCSDDEEDSRCNNLMSIASKNIVNEGDVQQLEDSNSEDDIHVLPPPKQRNPEVLTLESSSDSEEKVRIRNGTCIKSNNNKYRKIEKPPSSSLKAINEEGNSRSVHQISGIRGELGKKERDVAAGSESDSCDVDMPEATKGTDLTLNIDKRLTGWIKTITKDAPTNKRKIDVTKNPQNKRNCSSVDFTKGRPDTKTKPSCEKWTQSMANFYDSDVSDEFDVSEIHHQQSGSPADWPLIAADYQITRKRRYYNVTERCRRCREQGHPISKCPRVPVCHLCSSTNHCYRSKCPENCCFKCGGEPHYFCPIMDLSRTCHLCSYPGHQKDLCPDLWRRFHLTTNGLRAKTPIGCLPRPLGERYCYCCSRQGHYGHECPVRFQNRSYVNVSQSVVSYGCPVTLFGGNFAVNVEGAPSPSLNEDVTSMHIKLRDVGRIIGKKGAMVQSIMKDSGAHVEVVHEGKPQVLLFGPSEARLKAQDIIKVLLGIRKSINNEVTKALNNSSSCHYLGNDVCDNVAMDVGNSQNIWNGQFSSHTDRKKGLILGNIKVFMKNIHTKKHINLSPAIKKLKKFKSRKESTPSEQLSEIEKKYLNLVAMNALANSDYGNSDEIQEKLTALLNLVESHPSSTISEDLCAQLTNTVQPFLNPSLEKLDELLQYAHKNNLVFLKHRRILKNYQNVKKGKAKKSKKFKDVRKEKGKDDKKIKPVKKIKGNVKKIKPVKKEKGENDKEIKPVEKEKGENDKGIKPVKKKGGKKIKKIKPVEKEKGENDKEIKPVKKKEGKKVKKIKPVEKEKGENDKEINAVKKEKVKNAPKLNPVKKGKIKNASKINGVKKGKTKNVTKIKGVKKEKAKIDKEINTVKKAKAKNDKGIKAVKKEKAKNDKGIKAVKKEKAKAESASKVKKNPKKNKKMAFKRAIVMKKTKPKNAVN